MASPDAAEVYHFPRHEQRPDDARAKNEPELGSQTELNDLFDDAADLLGMPTQKPRVQVDGWEQDGEELIQYEIVDCRDKPDGTFVERVACAEIARRGGEVSAVAWVAYHRGTIVREWEDSKLAWQMVQYYDDSPLVVDAVLTPALIAEHRTAIRQEIDRAANVQRATYQLILGEQAVKLSWG